MTETKTIRLDETDLKRIVNGFCKIMEQHHQEIRP